MTDFYSVLQRAVASLPDGSGPQRRAVYDKARKALLKQLQSFDPPLPSADVTAQRLALEDAIRKIENEIARQIRTRRAVQGAIPATGAARAAAPAQPQNGMSEGPALAAGSAASPQPGGIAPEPPPAISQADKEELLESAISEATLEAPADAAPSEPEPPVEAAPPPVVLPEPDPVPRAEVVFEEDARIEPTPPILDEPRLKAPASGSTVVEGEFDEVTDVEPVAARPALPTAEERRAKKADERRLKAERRERGKREKAAAATRPGKREGGRRSALARVAMPVLVLALLAGAGYAAYSQHEALLAVLDGEQERPTRAAIEASEEPVVSKLTDRLPSTLEGEDTRAVTTTAWPPPPTSAEPAAPEGAAAPQEPSAQEPSSPEPSSPEPARTVGENVSPFAGEPAETPAQTQIAAVEQELSEEEPAEEAAAAEAAAEAVTEAVDREDGAPISEFVSGNRQQAVLYEEAAQAGEPGSALAGSVEWSMIRRDVGTGTPEPIVRANASIAERNVNATVTIRENRDGALPASHLIEIEFDVPSDLEGGGIKNVPGIIMKESEQARGDALRGAAARVSSGLFWIALSEDEADREQNLRLLRERDWIDIPILYESGRRAILTLRKGNDGLQSVNAAIQAWQAG